MIHRGKLTKLFPERGYGFIQEEDGEEIFFHRKDFQNIELHSLKEGQEVQFDVEQTSILLKAVNIKLLAKNSHNI
jgi:CspA family cold shock protein